MVHFTPSILELEPVSAIVSLTITKVELLPMTPQ